jgi:hypothetical protein
MEPEAVLETIHWVGRLLFSNCVGAARPRDLDGGATTAHRA